MCWYHDWLLWCQHKPHAKSNKFVTAGYTRSNLWIILVLQCDRGRLIVLDKTKPFEIARTSEKSAGSQFGSALSACWYRALWKGGTCMKSTSLYISLEGLWKKKQCCCPLHSPGNQTTVPEESVSWDDWLKPRWKSFFKSDRAVPHTPVYGIEWTCYALSSMTPCADPSASFFDSMAMSRRGGQHLENAFWWLS